MDEAEYECDGNKDEQRVDRYLEDGGAIRARHVEADIRERLHHGVARSLCLVRRHGLCIGIAEVYMGFGGRGLPAACTALFVSHLHCSFRLRQGVENILFARVLQNVQ